MSGVITGNECTFGDENTFQEVNMLNCNEYVENKHVYESEGHVEEGKVFQNFANASGKEETIAVEKLNIGSVESETTDLSIDSGSQTYRNFCNVKNESGNTEFKEISIGNAACKVDEKNPDLKPKSTNAQKFENFLNPQSTGGKTTISGLTIGCTSKTITRK